MPDYVFPPIGLGLEAWVHTDTTYYVEVPLGSTTRFSDPGTGEA